MRQMNEQWTADIVGRLHRINVTQSEFAYFCGITPQYLSSILNGKKKFASDYAKQMARKRLQRSLYLLEQDYAQEQ